MKKLGLLIVIAILYSCGGSSSSIPKTPVAEINSIDVLPNSLRVSQAFTLTLTTATQADTLTWAVNPDASFDSLGGDLLTNNANASTLIVTGLAPTQAGTYAIDITLTVDNLRSDSAQTQVLLVVLPTESDSGPTSPELVDSQSAPTASYTIELVNRWSSSQPSDAPPFPSSAHLTQKVYIAHSDSVSFWSAGVLATNGIEQLAEIGATAPLVAEVDSGGDAVASRLVGRTLFVGESDEVVLEFSATHSLITTASMLGPSPDWFIGVHDLNLRHQTGLWYRSISCPLVGYDAGTEQGIRFSLNNPASNPPQTIHRLSSDTALINAGFTITESFATLTLTVSDVVNEGATTDAMFVCP